jgi:hypothetical protein
MTTSAARLTGAMGLIGVTCGQQYHHSPLMMDTATLSRGSSAALAPGHQTGSRGCPPPSRSSQVTPRLASSPRSVIRCCSPCCLPGGRSLIAGTFLPSRVSIRYWQW